MACPEITTKASGHTRAGRQWARLLTAQSRASGRPAACWVQLTGFGGEGGALTAHRELLKAAQGERVLLVQKKPVQVHPAARRGGVAGRCPPGTESEAENARTLRLALRGRGWGGEPPGSSLFLRSSRREGRRKADGGYSPSCSWGGPRGGSFHGHPFQPSRAGRMTGLAAVWKMSNRLSVPEFLPVVLKKTHLTTRKRLSGRQRTTPLSGNGSGIRPFRERL